MVEPLAFWRAVKRFLFGVGLICLASVAFHAQILGMAARLSLKIQYDCEGAYRSVRWEEGALVFSDFVLFNSSFQTRIERAALRFDWSVFPKQLKAHLTIDGPRVCFSKRPMQGREGSPWIVFSVQVRDGLLDWEGPVHFSLDHEPAGTRIAFDWNDSSALVQLHSGKAECELKNFRATLLNPWMPFGQITGGKITGHLMADDQGNLLSANGTVGSLGCAFSGASFENLCGTVSFNAHLGAKCEVQGTAKAGDLAFPFTFEGKGFVNGSWLDAHIRFEDSWCRFEKDPDWKIECHRMRAQEARWLQQGLVEAMKCFRPALLWTEIASWEFLAGRFTGKASFEPSTWTAHFQAEQCKARKGGFLVDCETAQGEVNREGGEFAIVAKDYALQCSGTWKQWQTRGSFQGLELVLSGGWDGEKMPILIEKGTYGDLRLRGSGWIEPNLDLFFSCEGEWTLFNQPIPFYCSNLSKRGEQWNFDVRCSRKTWDLFRVSGSYNGQELIYSDKSHLLGVPLHFQRTPVGQIDAAVELPWTAILSAGPFLNRWGVDLRKIPSIQKTSIRFQLNEGQIDLTAEGDSSPFALRLHQNRDEWRIDLDSELVLRAGLKKDGSLKGRGSWKGAVSAEFDGKIDSSLHCEFSLPNVSADLHLLSFLEMEGKVEGQGHFVYKGHIESDFDLNVSSLVVGSYPLENKGAVHLNYSSIQGALFSGIDLHGKLDCMIDFLQYDTHRSRWIFQKMQLHLPASLFSSPILPFLNPEKEIHVTADLDLASDLSSLACRIDEATLPCSHADYPVERLNIAWEKGKGSASFYTDSKLVCIEAQTDGPITGRLTLGEEAAPLAIDWMYNDQLFIRSIEGSFGGIDASFHAEAPNLLIGSARLDFSVLKSLLPLDAAQVFDEIKMGKGYELKGRLKIDGNQPLFRGILSGKSLELFGFQFRTLLAQVDLSPQSIRIYDLKISDSAGIMKIDELIVQGTNDTPWTIRMPHLTILELRPSLLQRPGETPGPLSPLVIRELTLSDFKGLLDDGKTYTADGALRFINSYKRGETLFDLPANVFSRIIGLDLDLLIPVTGELTFHLNDGYFNLLELRDAYSEAERSQFFLEMDPPPRMDLDGRLEIFIKMKQFVLFKITESFLISIDGVLNQPEYHLKKRRFFGFGAPQSLPMKEPKPAMRTDA